MSKYLTELRWLVAASRIAYLEEKHDLLYGDRPGAIVSKIMANVVKVDRGFEGGPCYEWQGSTSGDKGRGHSYPRMSLDGQTVAVHRALWVTLNGYLPGKKQLDHLCKNRRCVLHCEPVTHKENQRRRDGKAPRKNSNG
jgi:hypothetical protein